MYLYRYYRRRFLNRCGHHAGADVLAIVEALPKNAEDDRWARELRLEIAASRSIRRGRARSSDAQ